MPVRLSHDRGNNDAKSTSSVPAPPAMHLAGPACPVASRQAWAPVTLPNITGTSEVNAVLTPFATHTFLPFFPAELAFRNPLSLAETSIRVRPQPPLRRRRVRDGIFSQNKPNHHYRTRTRTLSYRHHRPLPSRPAKPCDLVAVATLRAPGHGPAFIHLTIP